ncbi:outer membrane beta-barrel protein [Maribellus mangrovi]|uniref:outer membrane beta-barrel protein n=1 Tax=Maribellus mangrovi TaxID=3133146 RepID=UPI0030EB8621
MKKLTLLTALLVIGFTSVFSQVELKGLVGMNFATFHGTEADITAKAGYQFGGGVLMGNKFYVEPGIQFVRNSRVISAATTSDEITFSQNMVKIPVYAGYHLLGAEDQPFALRVFAGPAVSIPGKVKDGGEFFDKDNVNSAIWAVDGGVGLDIFFLFIEANYEYSFNDYFSDAFDGDNGKHGAFIINAGVHIDF